MSNNPIAILLVEDNPADAQLIRYLLDEAPDVMSTTFAIHQVDRISRAWDYLDRQQFDLILLDLSLPDGQGLNSLKKIKERARNTPIIVLSGLDDETVAMTAMQQGSQDYLVKGSTDTELLVRAIRYAIERQRLMTEHIQAKAQLSQQAAQLQRRNAELDEFAHTVAHQVQGLLGQIIGYSSFLEMAYLDALDEQGQLVVKRILQSGHKMNNVLSEILLLASVNRETFQTSSLDMERVVGEACKRLAFEIKEHGAQLHFSENWPVAVGYASWIEEVWVNYISNGLKYGGDPPVLHLGATAHDDATVCFWVKDNGPGISEIDQKKLFVAHTRLQQTRARGEGLGLSIVRRIIEKCHGKVGVISREGEGSTFWFSLPVTELPTGNEERGTRNGER
jgi:two-component system, sensor histidine kinase and response regulator